MTDGNSILTTHPQTPPPTRSLKHNPLPFQNGVRRPRKDASTVYFHRLSKKGDPSSQLCSPVDVINPPPTHGIPSQNKTAKGGELSLSHRRSPFIPASIHHLICQSPFIHTRPGSKSPQNLRINASGQRVQSELASWGVNGGGVACATYLAFPVGKRAAV